MKCSIFNCIGADTGLYLSQNSLNFTPENSEFIIHKSQLREVDFYIPLQPLYFFI